MKTKSESILTLHSNLIVCTPPTSTTQEEKKSNTGTNVNPQKEQQPNYLETVKQCTEKETSLTINSDKHHFNHFLDNPSKT